MAISNLTGQKPYQSFRNLMQISSSGQVYDGLGNLVTSLQLTASFVSGSSNSGGTGAGFPFSGSAVITGSLLVSSSLTVTGSLNVSGSITANSAIIGIGTTAITTPSYGFTPNISIAMNTGSSGAVLGLRNTSSSLQPGDALGTIQFAGTGDTTNMYASSQIKATVTQTPSTGNSGGGNIAILTSQASSGAILLERMRVNSSGQVLVGLTSSLDTTSKLIVSGSTSLLALLVGSGSSNSTPIYGAAPNAVIGMNTGSSGAVLELRNTSQSISAGSILGTIQFTAAGSGGTYSSTQICSTVTTSPGSGNSGGGNLSLWTTPSSAGSLAERMRINSLGNVGINTTSPNAKLDVNGNAIITGSLNVTQGITGSLFGTASYAIQALSASFAQTASFAPLYLPLTGGTIDGNLTVAGTASISYLNVTFESASVIYSSGSNQFGDATNDVQTLNGTVIVSGSQQITGSLTIAGSITSSGNIVPSTTATYDLGTTSIKFRDGWFSRNLHSSTTWTNNIAFETTDLTVYNSSGTQITGKWFGATGNLALQSGSVTAPVDDGVNRLQVSGSARITNGLTLTGSLTVSGSNTTQLVVGTNSLFVSSSGNIGIGTTNPSTTLQVSSATNQGVVIGTTSYPNWMGTDGLYVDGQFRANAYLVGSGGTINWGASQARIMGYNPYTNSDTYLSFFTGGTAYGERMRIIDNGNVGIGKTNPSTTLDVSGSVSVTGSLLVSGSARITNGLTVTGSLLISSSAGMTVDGINIGRGSGYIESNTAIGSSALYNNTIGTNNCALGSSALYTNTIGNNNVAIGSAVLNSNLNGSQNIGIGQGALQNSLGSNNNSIGQSSLPEIIYGENNIAFGRFAGRYIADKATLLTSSIDNSILLGHQTSPLGQGQTNQIVIGYNSTGLGSNTTVLGNSSTVTTAIYGNLLLGTTTDIASSKLTVSSTTQGVLLPRMTTVQVNAIVSPVQGLTVFNTDLNTLCFYTTSWQKVTSTAM